MSRKMKESNIYYLNNIPEDWKIAKYKIFSKSRMGETILTIDTEKEGIPIYSATQDNKIFGYTNSPKIILKKGDLVIPARGNSIGCVSYINDEKATCTQTTICSYDIHDINNKFYYYVILGLNNEWFRYDGSAIPQITVEQVKNNYLPVPSIAEQEKIANYLDKKVAKINQIIEDNKKIIKLIEEYKLSIIDSCIKRGLNNEEMIESGVAYLGLVPKKWKTTKLGRIFEIKKEIAGKEGYDVLAITQKGIKIKDIQSNEGQLASDYSKYQLVNINDFAMNHMDLLTGWVDCSKYSGVTSPDYRVFKISNDKISNRKYYLYFLQLCYKEKIFYGFGKGVSNFGRWRLPKEEFLNTILPVPNIEEQQEIVNFLDKKTNVINELVDTKERIIEKLEEYKKSLIYEVVTGKVEVK